MPGTPAAVRGTNRLKSNGYFLREVGMNTRYETDVVAWANEQARLIRAGRFDLLDLEHIAEEIEDVGKSEQRELASRMAVLLAHLLKWQYQPDRRGASWRATLKTQRHLIDKRLVKTPSLRPMLGEVDWIEDMWADARQAASQESGIGFAVFPEACPWSMAAVLSADFFPDS